MNLREFNPLEQKNIKPINEKNEKWWNIYGTPEPYESPEGFLNREYYNFSFNKLSIGRISLEEFITETKKKINEFFKAKREHMPSSQLDKNFKILADIIDVYKLESSTTGIDKVDYFSNTMNHRPLFVYDSWKNRPVDSLFGINEIKEKEIKDDLIKLRIENKNILLLGGGNSVLDILIHEDTFVSPKSVTNVDPYIHEELIQKNLKKIYQSVTMKAEDVNLPEELEKQSIPKSDEIWATFSVPFYLEKVEEIENLFKNIDKLLAPGGTARIWTLQLGSLEDKKPLFNPDSFEERKEAWLKSVKSLIDTGRYNLEILEGKSMHLQKLE